VASEFSTTHDADRVGRGFTAAARDLADLQAANLEAGRTVIAAARPPRRSGALAAGLFADADDQGVTMGSRAPYWSWVHWGAPRRRIKAQPFLLAARRSREDQVVRTYADHARSSFTDNL
jgi:hypothetical protein